MDKKKPIESVVNIYDSRILWTELGPEYNGYQISNTGLVRSMKFYKKYPYGILIEPVNGYIRISNSLNEVVQVDVIKIFNSKKITDFIIPTTSTYARGRNPLITSKSTIMKNKHKYDKELKKPSGFHFTTID